MAYAQQLTCRIPTACRKPCITLLQLCCARIRLHVLVHLVYVHSMSLHLGSARRLAHPVDCLDGAEFEVINRAVNGRQISTWASRTCFKYEQQAPRSCERVQQRGEDTICPSQLPEGKISCLEVLQ
jgi:hypothetical protein